VNKKHVGDLIYSIAGIAAMNGVIQFLLYPYLTARMGAEDFGTALAMISLVSIVGSTFGVAANYSRVVTKARNGGGNGDYNIFLLMICLVSVAVSAVGMLWFETFSWIEFLLFYLLMIFTLLRYYADVEFRLKVNYKGYLIFYILISLGYLLGMLLFPYTKSWKLTILIGELLAVGYVIWKGTIFKFPLFEKTPFFSSNMRSIVIMSATELVVALVLNADRLLLQVYAGGAAVTVFYAATLIGKMFSLVTTPLNGVLIGHLAKNNKMMTGKRYGVICFWSITAGCVLSVMCVPVSYLFVGIMYPDVFAAAKAYFWLGNASQVLFFLSNTLTVILLRYADEKYQLYINVIYLGLFVCIAIPLVMRYTLWGMAIALLAVNLLKVILVALWGSRILKKQEKKSV